MPVRKIRNDQTDAVGIAAAIVVGLIIGLVSIPKTPAQKAATAPAATQEVEAEAARQRSFDQFKDAVTAVERVKEAQRREVFENCLARGLDTIDACTARARR
jgi:predicted methyltransferase